MWANGSSIWDMEKHLYSKLLLQKKKCAAHTLEKYADLDNDYLINFLLFLIMYMHSLHACACGFPWKPEVSYSPGAEVAGSFKRAEVDVGIQTGPLESDSWLMSCVSSPWIPKCKVIFPKAILTFSVGTH